MALLCTLTTNILFYAMLKLNPLQSKKTFEPGVKLAWLLVS